MMRYEIQKSLLVLLQLGDIVDSVLFTLSTTSSNKAILGKSLCSRTCTLFSSILHVMWRQSKNLQQDWNSDRLQLTVIDTQYLFLTFNYYLTSCHKQTIENIFVHTPDSIRQSFISQTGWNNENLWTMNTRNFSKSCNQFLTNAKVFSFILVQKNLSGSSANL